MSDSNADYSVASTGVSTRIDGDSSFRSAYYVRSAIIKLQLIALDVSPELCFIRIDRRETKCHLAQQWFGFYFNSIAFKFVAFYVEADWLEIAFGLIVRHNSHFAIMYTKNTYWNFYFVHRNVWNNTRRLVSVCRIVIAFVLNGRQLTLM